MRTRRAGSTWIRVTLATTVAAAVVGLTVSPVPAGEKKKPCSASAEACLRMMADNLSKKGWIGIEMQKKDEKGRPVITRVVPESPAVKAGFREGDTLIGINGLTEADGEEAAYAEWKRAMVPANKVVVNLLRNGKPLDLPVTLGTIPDAVIAQWIGEHMLQGHLTAAADSDDEADTGSP